MKIRSVVIVLSLTMGFFITLCAAHAASANPALLNAKQDAEAKGYIFETSHEEILAKAKVDWPLGASVFSPGSALEALPRGKKLSVIDWTNDLRVDDDLKKIVEALGFPKAK